MWPFTPTVTRASVKLIFPCTSPSMNRSEDPVTSPRIFRPAPMEVPPGTSREAALEGTAFGASAFGVGAVYTGAGGGAATAGAGVAATTGATGGGAAGVTGALGCCEGAFESLGFASVGLRHIVSPQSGIPGPGGRQSSNCDWNIVHGYGGVNRLALFPVTNWYQTDNAVPADFRASKRCWSAPHGCVVPTWPPAFPPPRERKSQLPPAFPTRNPRCT